MFNNNKILAVIPARGGSKGIPRKNIRLLKNKPLISYSINTAKSSKYIDDVIVTTDDAEIALISEKFGASVIRRSAELTGDEVPLDPVIYDALIQKEKQTFDEYDIVITMQPTSPFLKIETLDRVIEKFEDFDVDNVISVRDDRHLNWGYDENNQKYFPLYKERLNRQFLPKSFRETGGILASRRHCVTKDSRLANNIELVEVAPEESVDIDSYSDWWIADAYARKRKIAIVVDAYDVIGTGHIYRCVSLASKLVKHDVMFFLRENHQLGIDIVNGFNYPFKTYDDKEELFNLLNEFNPNIVINDILDTSRKYIARLQNQGYFVCNFEDLGTGTELANVVFDALYEHELNTKNVFKGHKYYILKDEFYFQPHKIITQTINNVLITFGGTDPNNLTEKVLDAILESSFEGRINVILGLGYNGTEKLVSKHEDNPSVQIYQNVSNISEFMFKADIIFTSAGRTMYEICSIGVPTICLCQNHREKTHIFANTDNGFINMGLGSDVSRQEIIDKFDILSNDFEIREEFNRRMLSIDLKHGFENIVSILKEEYRKFELKNDLM